MLAFDALRDGVGKIQHAANMNVNAEQWCARILKKPAAPYRKTLR